MARNTSEANLQIAPEKLEDNAKNLSDLPDDILGHILSFMETREAVRTSTLSKRWKYVRTFTPNLVFDDFRFWFIKENLWKHVGDYVAREIHLRGFVRSFGFEVRHYGIVAALLRSWITELVMRNVQDVSLLLNSSDEHNVLPDCLFTCKSLVHFKFSIGGIVSLELPSTIYFSNLKTLSLRNVRFLNEHSTNQLFSSCPVLEDLTLNDCRWSDFQLINICAPKLLRLTIFERVHFGYTNPHGCRIAVFGPNLTDFVYDGDFFNEHYLYNATSLEKACIRQGCVEHHNRLYQLLQCLSSVKDLELGLDDYEVPKGVGELLDDMPMFKNLTRLDVNGYVHGSLVLNSNIGLMKLLKNSPRLEVLKASWVFRLPLDQDDINPMPPCFRSHLKIIEVHISDGKESYNALKSLLRNAHVLKKIVISFCSDSKRDKFWERRILKLPKISKDCKVIVERSYNGGEDNFCLFYDINEI